MKKKMAGGNHYGCPECGSREATVEAEFTGTVQVRFVGDNRAAEPSGCVDQYDDLEVSDYDLSEYTCENCGKIFAEPDYSVDGKKAVTFILVCKQDNDVVWSEEMVCPEKSGTILKQISAEVRKRVTDNFASLLVMFAGGLVGPDSSTNQEDADQKE